MYKICNPKCQHRTEGITQQLDCRSCIVQNQELDTENTRYQGKRQNLRREDPSREGLDDPMSAWSGSKADTLTDFKLRIKHLGRKRPSQSSRSASVMITPADWQDEGQ